MRTDVLLSASRKICTNGITLANQGIQIQRTMPAESRDGT